MRVARRCTGPGAKGPNGQPSAAGGALGLSDGCAPGGGDGDGTCMGVPPPQEYRSTANAAIPLAQAADRRGGNQGTEESGIGLRLLDLVDEELRRLHRREVGQGTAEQMALAELLR